MTNFLVKFATKNVSCEDDKRQKIGYMASIVGIVVNIILSVIKLSIGFLISSISVIADGFNNVTDTFSSVITLLGFKLSSMPPDKEHPYGHGRIEYISGLIVAFLVMLVGFQFIMSSFKEIMDSSKVNFEMIPFIILVVSILSKIWLSYFNKKLGEEINSKALKATALDSLGDVLTTSVVVVSLFFGRFTSIPVDGYVGIVVSLLIIYNGYNIVKETISPLIGEAPSKELIEGIKADVLSYDFISGVHDLLIHSYGENRNMAVIDAEFPAELDIIKVYKEIRRAEREIGDKYDLTLVIHLDPIYEESDTIKKIKREIKDMLKEYPSYKSMHDFNILEIDGSDIIEFHMVICGKDLKKNETAGSIKTHIEEIVLCKFPKRTFDITIDIDYN